MAIGLESGRVRVAPYNAQWPVLFAREKDRLLDRLGNRVLEITHVGSTSVPGLDAKPIIDIAIAVSSFEAGKRCIAPIESLGYEYRGEMGLPGRHYFRKKSDTGLRTHHIHMYAVDHPDLHEVARFRNALRFDTTLRDAYAALKHDLARRFPEDRQAYVDGKTAFVESVVARPAVSDPAHALDHDLAPHFDRIRSLPHVRALNASPYYAGLRHEIDRLLSTVVRGDFAPDAPQPSDRVTAVAWNIERGRKLDDILTVFENHPEASRADLLLLTELDVGMARSGNRDVPLEIARRLGMNYAFVPSYLNLRRGSGLEFEVEGENRQAIHGNAVFSRWPIRNAHRIALPNGKDKLKSREQRLGSQGAVVATIAHPAGAFHAVSIHLDAHSSQRHRAKQMRIILDRVDALSPRLPVLLGGDWNTTTGNTKRHVYAIAGFYRRLAMGVNNVLDRHYPYPERWFERHLFRLLETRGYDYRNTNRPGDCTLTYDVVDLAQNSGLADWLPGWCFAWIEWALKEHDGKCALKLDWFAGRGIAPIAGSPHVMHDVEAEFGKLSDHEPIYLEFVPDP